MTRSIIMIRCQRCCTELSIDVAVSTDGVFDSPCPQLLHAVPAERCSCSCRCHCPLRNIELVRLSYDCSAVACCCSGRLELWRSSRRTHELWHRQRRFLQGIRIILRFQDLLRRFAYPSIGRTAWVYMLSAYERIVPESLCVVFVASSNGRGRCYTLPLRHRWRVVLVAEWAKWVLQQ